MECGGSYSPKSFPGEAALKLAKRLTELPSFETLAPQAFFAWDTDEIILFSQDGTELSRMPLRATFEKYAEELK